jgi:hypothetical protein
MHRVQFSMTRPIKTWIRAYLEQCEGRDMDYFTTATYSTIINSSFGRSHLSGRFSGARGAPPPMPIFARKSASIVGKEVKVRVSARCMAYASQALAIQADLMCDATRKTAPWATNSEAKTRISTLTLRNCELKTTWISVNWIPPLENVARCGHFFTKLVIILHVYRLEWA